MDVRGNEVSGEGSSWKVTHAPCLPFRADPLPKNADEVMAVIQIARSYQQKRRPFRLITPYDAQRNELEIALKSSGLPWEDKCFNLTHSRVSVPFLK